MLITQNDALPYFKAEAFLTKYLLSNSNEMTVISNPFYLWIPQYVFHLDHVYYGFLGVGEVKTKNLIFIVDNDFRDLISFDDDYAHRLQKLYNSYDKNVLATFADAKILVSNVLQPSSQNQQINLIDKNHIWKPFNHAVLSQENDTLTIKVDTNKGKAIYNRAFFPIQLNSTSTEPLLLTLDYLSKSIKGNATFFAEIRDSSNSKILWSSHLNNLDGQSTIETFLLPSDIVNRPLELRLYVITHEAGEHILTIKNMRIY